MDSLSLHPGFVLLVTVALLVAGALFGAVLALVGAWMWYTLRLVNRIERRGDLYLSDWDNEQARKLKLAYELSTSMEFQRQALRMLDPALAREFTREEPADTGEKKKGKKNGNA